MTLLLLFELKNKPVLKNQIKAKFFISRYPMTFQFNIIGMLILFCDAVQI